MTKFWTINTTTFNGEDGMTQLKLKGCRNGVEKARKTRNNAGSVFGIQKLHNHTNSIIGINGKGKSWELTLFVFLALTSLTLAINPGKVNSTFIHVNCWLVLKFNSICIHI
jgi:hypothetical protein